MNRGKSRWRRPGVAHHYLGKWWPDVVYHCLGVRSPTASEAAGDLAHVLVSSTRPLLMPSQVNLNSNLKMA
ncbi:hypothetical protein CRG98_013551 [Punica granatum]|uniref:Uncharacterized protein n=1 Tax=Punica granatum TaxID=22663 RepID=A0A2I0KE60_PUNGR|nr:hypothetical protein CRG98_013551 [Punica granatum]